MAWAVGTFLQVVVFDLEDQESIRHAGAWGYVAGLFLLALTALPALAGISLGIRARHLGERSRGAAGVVVNALIVAYSDVFYLMLLLSLPAFIVLMLIPRPAETVTSKPHVEVLE